MTDEVNEYLGDLDNWDLDVLELSDMTKGRPLFVLANAIVAHHDLLAEISCTQQTFTNFITAIELGYANNPYHNSSHAADVLNGCHHFVKALDFDKVLTKNQMVSLLIAAAIHDFEHPGLSNAFLIKTKHELAVRYNDDSVCERMHVARAFAVMQQEGTDCNILVGLQSDNYRDIRSSIIDIVMITDLSQHLDYTAKIRSMAANGKNEDIMFDSNYLMQIAIKSSDLGHCAKKMETHLKWLVSILFSFFLSFLFSIATDFSPNDFQYILFSFTFFKTYRTALISEEMFRQGDKEKSLGIKVSAFCDRDHGDIPKSQVGFFTIIINPFFSAIVDLDPRFGSIKKVVLRNYMHWKHLNENGDRTSKTIPDGLNGRASKRSMAPLTPLTVEISVSDNTENKTRTSKQEETKELKTEDDM